MKPPNTMCKIIIKDILKDNDYPQAGGYVFDVMEKCIPNGETVTLNMEGVEVLPSMFLNASIGRYVEKYGIASLKGRLSFEKILSSLLTRIKDYLNRIA